MILSSRPLAGPLPPSRWALSLVVSGVFLVSACVVVVPGADDFDYPVILAVDASCDDEGYFELC